MNGAAGHFRIHWRTIALGAAAAVVLTVCAGGSFAESRSPRCDHAPAASIIPRFNPAARADDRNIPAPRASRLIGSRETVPSPPAADPQTFPVTPGPQIPPPPNPSLPSPAPEPSVIREEEADESSPRVERLRLQLELLRRHLAQSKRALPPAAPDSEPPSEPEFPSPSEPPPTPVEEGAPATTDPEPPAAAEPAPLPDLPEIPNPRSAPIAADAVPLRAEPILKGLPTSTADRVAIADNLFAAGEIVTAAHVYGQIDHTELSRAEAGWVQYQIASCHRRLGKLDEARKGYRKLVTDPSLGWLQDLSKWWLGMLDEREALTREHARLKEIVQQVERERRVTPR